MASVTDKLYIKSADGNQNLYANNSFSFSGNETLGDVLSTYVPSVTSVSNTIGGTAVDNTLNMGEVYSLYAGAGVGVILYDVSPYTGDYKIIKAIRNGVEYELPGDKCCFIDYLVVGGGGGGGLYGGGGAGGYLENCKYSIDASSYCVIIGSGGTGTYNYGNNGSCSKLGNNIIAYGGGGGGSGDVGGTGKNGGSGGGGGMRCACGGAGCSGQGNNGGEAPSINCNYIGGGGGGGAGGSGCSGTYGTTNHGTGGLGRISNISGANICYSGGGGGFNACYSGSGQGAYGGGSTPAGNATTYGSGGGAIGNGTTPGGCGCQGIVIVRYPTDGSYGINCATGGCVYTCGNYTIHCFTSNGTFCIVS